MPYTISYLNSGRVEADEQWNGDFEEAKRLAKKAVGSGSFGKCEIRDDSGALIFHTPRVLRRAGG